MCSGCPCPSSSWWSSTRRSGPEPDPEIQELIAASGGTNLRMDFLRGAPVHAQAPAERRAVARDLPGEWGSAEVYASHLTARLEHREAFVEEAEDARA